MENADVEMEKELYDAAMSGKENSDENTPLHIAAEVGNLNVTKLLFDYYMNVERGDYDVRPWRLKNSKGNTVVHVALSHGNVKVARFLLDKDPYLASILNDLKEAPLHIAMKQHLNHEERESIVARVKQPLNRGGAALEIKCEPGEEITSIIKFLVKNASWVASWPDSKGLTPLHKAASLSSPNDLQLVKLFIKRCPQSAEVCDANGKSILHLLVNKMHTYKVARETIIKRDEIYALRNHQDQNGDTPLHIALKHMDIIMVRVLLESEVNLNINNNDGICAISLIQHQNLYHKLRHRELTNEECEAVHTGEITFLRDKMSRLGIDFLLSKDKDGKTVLHKLMQINNESSIQRNEYVDFIQEVLEMFPAIVCQTDESGNTPIHILVQNHPETKLYIGGNYNVTYDHVTLRKSGLLLELLDLCNKYIIQHIQDEAALTNNNYSAYDAVSPWMIQNAAGNTPLHESLMANNNFPAMALLEYNPNSAKLLNKLKETPLHVLAKVPGHMEPLSREGIEMMVTANPEAAYWLDNDDLTPILRAFESNNWHVVTILCSIIKEAAKIPDPKGKTVVHLLVKHPSSYFAFGLIRDRNLRDLFPIKDNDGNTLLHLAIETKRFDLVRIFLETWEEELKPREKLPKDQRKWLIELFDIPNLAGKTPSDLIAELLTLPHDIANNIGNKYEMIGYRSKWGVPTVEIKDYVNTMGIIAALLTTITFTTAFTVPGGLLEDVGTPVLIGYVAFQIFLISDVLAMCLSMMVLICLLWIVACSNRRNAIMLLDLSIALLLASSHATFITFMTGLFATIYPVRPWIAILTLILCSFFMLLVHKLLINKLLIPFNKIMLSNYRMIQRFVTKIKKIKYSAIRRNRGEAAASHTTRSAPIQLLHQEGHTQQHSIDNV